eukprot:TRINITY_DN2235_c3_g1_i1.p1 TRINITY_DN2235_c3_g1~~TRINITY_DN2235_c3_g1_i1.p1  ORF type:complete len:402 (+),score=133.42 TRINITY_DN2235_c3_g1_i1:98-1303(+)
MGKDDFLTPKAIGKKIKAKGLQKLKFYCVVCQKQMRDANGFKCHLQSEPHKRMMQVFLENPSKRVDENSKEFEETFMDILQHRHGTTRVKANNVYQELIHDRHHIHMTGTVWATLSDFVLYLGREGKVEVDEEGDGLYVRYLKKDPRALLEKEKERKRLLHQKSDDERVREFIALQMKMEKEGLEEMEDGDDGESESETIDTAKPLSEDRDKISISLSGTKRPRIMGGVGKPLHPSIGGKTIQKKSDRTIFMEKEKEKEKEEKEEKEMDEDEIDEDDEEPWLHRGIVVRVLNKTLASGQYYRKKGVVKAVENEGFLGVVELAHSGLKLRIDQNELQTVVPAIGRSLCIVSGPHHGRHGELVDIDKKHGKATIRILSTGELIHKIPFDQFSKLEKQSSQEHK